MEPKCPRQLFAVDSHRAAAELKKADGSLAAINPYSDADELSGFVDSAQAHGILTSEAPGGRLCVYPLSISEPKPLLVVNVGVGPVLLGSRLELRQGDDEDPISFTVRVLEEIATTANGLATEHGPDSIRLDRIADFMNRPGPWNGGDVCEFVAQELVFSGREIVDED